MVQIFRLASSDAPNSVEKHPIAAIIEESDEDFSRQKLEAGEIMLSAVIPLMNELENLPPLYQRLKMALNRHAPNHEIIFIDDGSQDGSYRKLQEIWRADRNCTVLHFRRNYGKSAALTAGFECAAGAVILMMDADLQDQPEELPRLIEKMDEGYDLVTGWKQRRHDPLNKTLPSKLFNNTVAKYFKLDIHDFNCGYKLMKVSVARELHLYGDMHRFIPVLAASRGYQVAECVVKHAPRVHGVSKYGAKRLITGMLDFTTTILITKFANRPLQMFGGIGLATSSAGVLVGFYLSIEMLFGQGAHIRPLWMVMLLLLLGGGQIFFTGLLAELLVNVSGRGEKTYTVTNVLKPNRSDTVVRNIIGTGADERKAANAGGVEITDQPRATVAEVPIP